MTGTSLALVPGGAYWARFSVPDSTSEAMSSPYLALCFKQSQRANNLRLLRLHLVLNDAETVTGPQVYGEGSQLLVVYTNTQLAIERIFRRILQGVTIDGIYHLLQLWRRGEKEPVPCFLIILFEPLIRAQTRPRWAAELARATVRLLFQDVFHPLEDEIVLL